MVSDLVSFIFIFSPFILFCFVFLLIEFADFLTCSLSLLVSRHRTNLFELRASLSPHHHILHNRPSFNNLLHFISLRSGSPRDTIRYGGPHPIEFSERSSRSQLGFQGLRTRRKAYRRAVEADPHAVWDDWVGRRLHVQKGFVIAVAEVYWMVTSKKLKVMYESLLITLICFIVFVTTQTRNQTGSLVVLTSCPPCG